MRLHDVRNSSRENSGCDRIHVYLFVVPYLAVTRYRETPLSAATVVKEFFQFSLTRDVTRNAAMSVRHGERVMLYKTSRGDYTAV